GSPCTGSTRTAGTGRGVTGTRWSGTGRAPSTAARSRACPIWPIRRSGSRRRSRRHNGRPMSDEEIEKYETDAELALFREYRDVLPMFAYAVETERRFYLANQVDLVPHGDDTGAWFEVMLTDVWVWDM